jgi:hypothetical protein
MPILLVLENRATDNVLLIKDDIELTDSQRQYSGTGERQCHDLQIRAQ